MLESRKIASRDPYRYHNAPGLHTIKEWLISFGHALDDRADPDRRTVTRSGHGSCKFHQRSTSRTPLWAPLSHAHTRHSYTRSIRFEEQAVWLG